MIRISRRLLLSAVGLFIGSRALAQGGGLFGRWYGVLDAAGTRLRLMFEIEAGPRAKLLSLDQGNVPVAAAETQIAGARIVMRFPQINASFEGRLVGGRIEGQFTQGVVLPLSLRREPPPAAAAHPPPPAPAPLTKERLAAYRAHAGSPAIAAAAANRAGAAINLAEGARLVGQAPAVTPNDLWHLGSITKSMTATLVARLVEQGAMSWDDRAGDVLGGAVPDMRDDYRRITFRHLLSHRGGLPANIDLQHLASFGRDTADAREERIAYARIALAEAPAGPAEKTFVYSNSGYVIAGAMLEARMDARWEDLIREHLFVPLGMRSAGFGAPGTAGQAGQPAGHAAGPDGLTPFPPGAPVTDNPAVLGPAGRVHTSLADILAYLAAHRDRTAFLRPENWEVLHRPPYGGDYAMGWVVRPDGLWHNGSNTLWYAEVLCSPMRGTAAAAAVNDGRVPIVGPTVAAVLQSAVLAVA